MTSRFIRSWKRGKDLFPDQRYDDALQSLRRANEMRDKKCTACYAWMTDARSHEADARSHEADARSLEAELRQTAHARREELRRRRSLTPAPGRVAHKTPPPRRRSPRERLSTTPPKGFGVGKTPGTKRNNVSNAEGV